MKKFRLAAAVSVAVLTMSVQAMAAPLNCNILSSGSSCPTSKTFTNAVKGIQTSNSTQNTCFNFTNIESILSQLNCNNGSSVKGASYVKGTTTTKGANCTTATKGFNCTTASKGSNCTTSKKAASRVNGASTNNCTGSNCTTGSKCTTTTKAVKGASFSNASNCFTGYNCTGSNCNTGCNN